MTESQDKENSEGKNFSSNFSNFHDKYYKLLLLIPIALIVFSFIYMGVFYTQTGEFFHKDISLTGGTSATVYDKSLDKNQLEEGLEPKLQDIRTRVISDLVTGEQKGVIIKTKSSGNQTREILENYLGYELTDENSSFEFTGSTLSQSFYKQLILALVFAFVFMGAVVFVIFGHTIKYRAILLALALIPPLSFFLGASDVTLTIFIALGALLISAGFYAKKSVPSFAVMVSAFADIFMTLTLVNLLGVELSTAGIVAFLMIIGYSVDTDILLTNRILKRKQGSTNERLLGSLKTGITMTLTSLLAVTVALIIVNSFSFILGQMFLILVIGLGFDILNTWITNVSIIKWYVEKGGK